MILNNFLILNEIILKLKKDMTFLYQYIHLHIFISNSYQYIFIKNNEIWIYSIYS